VNAVTYDINSVTPAIINRLTFIKQQLSCFYKVIMNRRKFFSLTGATIVVAGAVYYLSSDKSNFVRADNKDDSAGDITLKDDEKIILQLASLAPSGHNTQPWFVCL
jgi:nitroreductase